MGGLLLQPKLGCTLLTVDFEYMAPAWVQSASMKPIAIFIMELTMMETVK
jgi:hypothetical protein